VARREFALAAERLRSREIEVQKQPNESAVGIVLEFGAWPFEASEKDVLRVRLEWEAEDGRHCSAEATWHGDHAPSRDGMYRAAFAFDSPLCLGARWTRIVIDAKHEIEPRAIRGWTDDSRALRAQVDAFRLAGAVVSPRLQALLDRYADTD